MPDPAWQDATEILHLAHGRQFLNTLPASPHAVWLRTPDEALAATGSHYWLMTLRELQAEFPHLHLTLIVDAGDAAGLAQGAIADGHTHIRFTGHTEVKEKLTQIAHASGCTIVLCQGN